MNITITHTIDPAIVNLFQAFLGNVGGQLPAKSNGAKVKELAAAAPVQEVKADAPAAAVKTTSTTATEVSLSEIRSLVQNKSGEGKKDQVKALLADFGAPNVSALKADQYTDFYTKLQAI